MPLIVEDGTMPAGANSFASLADADAYHAARLTEAWADSLAGDKKEAALIRATDWLNRKVRWEGCKTTRKQRMAWPRTGVATRGGPVPSDEVPAEVVEACCELAGFFVEQDYLAPLDRGGDIASLSVDVISITYNGTAPAETVFPSLSGPLAGLGTVSTGKGGASWRSEEDERIPVRQRGQGRTPVDQQVRQTDDLPSEEGWTGLQRSDHAL